MSSRNLLIYGAGGFGAEVAAIAESGCFDSRHGNRWEIEGYIDDTPGYKGKTIHGKPCLGSLDEVIELRRYIETNCFLAIGNNEGRMRAADRIKAAGWKAASVIHAKAEIAWGLDIGEGTFIGLFSTVSPFVKIGRHTILNTRAAIGHHVELGDFSQVSLSASVLGHGKIGKGGFVGAHAIVGQGVSVGDWATIAIGTPAMTDVKAGHTISLPLARTLFKREIPA